MANEIIKRRLIDDAIAGALHKEPLAGRVLAGRGVTCVSELALNSKSLPQPGNLRDFETAATLLSDAVEQNKKIMVVGDYDADGATSTALAVHFLRAAGATVNYLVPNRFEYGYGLSAEIVAVALLQQPELILTVDNGVASHEGVQAAVDAGVTVVVTDHHLPADTLPAAHAIVNPNREDCEFPSKNLCGVGVVFYVLTGVCRRLQSSGWFERRSLSVPNMADYLDLVALGTVADVVPLDQTNRILVEQGIKRIRAGHTRPGIAALFAVATRQILLCCTQDFGFFVAPRLNAAGRLSDMTVGVECLLAADMKTATTLATELNVINSQRRSIQSGMNQEAEAQVKLLEEKLAGDLPDAIVLYEPHWHEGVIGIVAGRIKERCHRPVFAFAKAEDGSLKGSGRSIAGVHIRDALMAVVASHPGLLKKFGGHAMAAGASLAEQDYPAFAEAFVKCVSAALNGRSLTREWLTDGDLQDEEMSLENARLIQFLQPWGQAFPAPVFDDVFYVESVKHMKDVHSRMMIRRTNGKRSVPAVAFNRKVETSPEQAWRAVYRLEVNDFRNTSSLQLMIEYMEPVAG